MWKNSGEIDMLGHRIFFSKREKNDGFLFFLKNISVLLTFFKGIHVFDKKVKVKVMCPAHRNRQFRKYWKQEKK